MSKPFKKENYWWCIHDPTGIGHCSRRSDNFCLGKHCSLEWDGYCKCENCTLNKTLYCDNCFLNKENQKEISTIHLWCPKCKHLSIEFSHTFCELCSMNKIENVPTKFIQKEKE
jgi:hypothetical protein